MRRTDTSSPIWSHLGQTVSAPSENGKAGAVHTAALLRKARCASGRDRTLRKRNDGSPDVADGSAGRHHRAAESRKPDGVDQTHEQHPIQSRGNRLERAYNLINRSRSNAAPL